MTRLSSVPFALTAIVLLSAAHAMARPRFLSRLHPPKVSLRKAVQAAAYPVTKPLFDGGKAVLKAAETATPAGAVASVSPPNAAGVVKSLTIRRPK